MTSKELMIVKMAQMSSALEEIIALIGEVDDDWWFADNLPDDQVDKMGLKLKRILEAYRTDTAEIDDELERIEFEDLECE